MHEAQQSAHTTKDKVKIIMSCMLKVSRLGAFGGSKKLSSFNNEMKVNFPQR